jgi:hypothetical protein
VRCGESFTFLYVDDVHTSQEAWTTTVRYGDSFAFLYEDDERNNRVVSWINLAQDMDQCRAHYEHRHEPSVLVKFRDVLELLHN